ncbi:hypothetical protein POV26_14160 [Aequorivita todarodis]|uniref:hypothetical protein n=1 Tax=Aequorivita todarodis TaxID=2036821 RepID=UPI00235055E2|nr:hypothetical protein [Aequorivita todarodis]MDC8002187.1 hypothetical protein [Aequorivita todarodis]
MKKLILSTAIVLGGLTAATAQDKEPTAMNEQKQTAVEAQVENRIEAAQDADAVVETEATVATDAATAEIAATDVAQDYKEVKASEVPQAVQDAVAKDFSGATISKAYVNAQGDYKIELATADAKKATVYANAKGEWIKNELKKQ